MVEEKKECAGEEEYKGKTKSIEQCAEICTGVSTMFLFHNKRYCYCETSSRDDGTCKIIDNKNGYSLYKFSASSKYLIEINCFYKCLFRIYFEIVLR